MPEEHRNKFHHDLDELNLQVVQLAALVTEVIPRTTRALLDGDLQAAQAVIDHDDVLDRLSIAIEEHCLRLLALQQPMASDLRLLVTVLKLNWDLERSGDLAVNICKAVRRVYGLAIDPKLRGLIEQMSEEAFWLTRRAADAYVEADEGLAAALDDMDDRLDELQTEFVHTIIEVHDAGQLALQPAVQLALIGRYYERIGDHAVNVGERIRYMVSGWLPEHTGAARADLRERRAAGNGDV
jgi:phosphate transport system protein